MPRKLFALIILIGAVGFLVLMYLYFFVYYTATLVVNANVEGYNVELFSKSTAQKTTHICPEKECIITDVAPFEYNISVSKENYILYSLTTKIAPRKKQSIIVELEKKAILEVLEAEITEESAKQKIQRIRDQKEYFAVFQLENDAKITWKEENSQLLMAYHVGGISKEISAFPLSPVNAIQVQYIGDRGDEIFLQVADSYYIFDISVGKIYTLPFKLPIRYIKPAQRAEEYLVVSDRGTFLYNILTGDSSYQYLFRDFLYFENMLIGVIYEDEAEKKNNFNLTEKGNLIIRYDQKTKERKVLLESSLDIERIEWRGEQIIFSSKENEYELKNFD